MKLSMSSHNLTRILLMSIFGMFIATSIVHGAALDIPGTNQIRNDSIGVDLVNKNGEVAARDFLFRILSIMKLVVSGFALIYLVLIGVYMVIGSDSEERIKTQRKQITYVLIGFLFLNVPSLLYQVFMPNQITGSVGPVDDWKSTTGGYLWNTAGFEGIFGNIVAFLRVFVFGVAVLMLTWGLLRLIFSGGDDEARKQAKNRFIYGALALIFMGFVELWGRMISIGDFTRHIPGVAKQIVGLALYFAGPVAIFMLMIGAYFMITSAGDEERSKKGKQILINTFIGALILLCALSFLTELVKFQF